MLDDRKLLAIELLADGELNRTQIAEKVGIARQTIYFWLDDEEFRAALDERLHNRKVYVQKKIDGKLDFIVERLFEIANDNSNRRVQAQVLLALVDRSLGKPTSTVELKTSIMNKKVSGDVLENEFDELETIELETIEVDENDSNNENE